MNKLEKSVVLLHLVNVFVCLDTALQKPEYMFKSCFKLSITYNRTGKLLLVRFLLPFLSTPFGLGFSPT